jgi:chemotaxis protein methyltransferase CheR
MNTSDPVLEPSLTALAELIVRRIGLRCPRERLTDLLRALTLAAADLRLQGASECARALLGGQAEIEALARHLTNGETYFFREPAYLDILRREVLPQLADARRTKDRRLRVWSAGCATGEEAYTLSMMLEEGLPDLADWAVTLLGTDINADFLRVAEHGVYRPWSFRGVPPHVRECFFHRSPGDSWQIDRRVRERVTFARLNLAVDSFPDAIDLIFCRNVLMYFDPACATALVRRLSAALNDGGYLIVGAAEAALPLFAGYEQIRRSGAVIYRKPALFEPIEHSLVTAELPLAPAPLTATERPCDRYAAAHALFQQGRYGDAAEMATECLGDAPCDPKTLLLLTRIHANAGALSDALIWSERALDANKIDPAAHYAHATILAELDRPREAARALHRVLYLAPDHALAQYTLGMMAHRNCEPARARRHFENAQAILARRRPSETIGEIDGLTTDELGEIVRSMHALLEGEGAA